MIAFTAERVNTKKNFKTKGKTTMIDLTPVVQTVVMLVSALITCFLIPYIRAKADAEKLAKIQLWVNVAVEAAEQLYSGTGRGKEKKEYVVNFLNQKGFTIDADSIDKLIESAVLKLKLSE